MDIFRDKQAKSQMRRAGDGYETETLREKLNLFNSGTNQRNKDQLY